MDKNNLTYQTSGVNIKEADKFIKYISHIAKKTKQNKKSNNIGGFGSISNMPKNINNPKLVASTDGVGTKIEIANLLNKFDTIGIDLVAMCVNDLIVQGARPLLFLDYISINKINLKKLKLIIKGIVAGCKMSGCELAGGETAEMPGTYSKGKFDIAGFSLGVVDKTKILLKKKIKKNNLILAIPSSGLHSNGFSLVRYIINKKKINIKKNKFLQKELLKPTKIYVKEVLKLIDKKTINGCANITGGGLKDNIIRIIPDGLCANIDLTKLKTQPIFNWLKNHGVKDFEMLNTFNCGIGFCLVIDPKYLKIVQKSFSKNFKPYIIGEVIKGKKKYMSNGEINW